jgi:glutathione S-transferase
LSDLTLYTAEVCPYAQRSRIVLGEKGIPHEQVEIDLDNKPDWLLDLTPTGRVPVIRHGDFVLWESSIVNEYLDGSFAGPAMRPTDERGCAVMRGEIRHLDSVFLPVLYRMLFEQDEAEQAKLRGEVEEGMRFLETRLEAIQADGPYWLGANMSLADAAFFPFFERVPVFEHYRGLAIPNGCTRLRRWLEAVSERPAVAATCHDLAYFIPRYAHYAGGTAQGLSAQAFRSGAAN